MHEAIAQALRNEDREYSETQWSDAISSAGPVRHWGGVRSGNRLVDSRKLQINVSPKAALAPIQRIGGSTGWYCGNWIWSLRGWIDLIMGGAGMHRGKGDSIHLTISDTLDCWREEAFEPERRLRLAAEMKVPGRAWLEFGVTEDENGSIIRKTAIFDPAGLQGLLYWCSFYLFHQFVSSGMFRGIGRAARNVEKP